MRTIKQKKWEVSCQNTTDKNILRRYSILFAGKYKKGEGEQNARYADIICACSENVVIIRLIGYKVWLKGCLLNKSPLI
jgi:hypothetical protein